MYNVQNEVIWFKPYSDLFLYSQNEHQNKYHYSFQSKSVNVQNDVALINGTVITYYE